MANPFEPRRYIEAMKLVSAIVLASIVALAGAAPVMAGVNQEVKFARGASSATIEGSVIRGERDFYTVSAKAGQTMEVTVTAPKKNAALAIFKPGYRLKKADGMTDIQGQALKKAGEEDEARSWKGKLPEDGNYLVSVGGVRGNVSYKLKISIK